MPGTDGYYTAYLPLVVIIVVGVLLVGAMFTGNRLLRPTHATPEKRLTYECGVDPVGEGWAQTHVRYYVYAYLYVSSPSTRCSCSRGRRCSPGSAGSASGRWASSSGSSRSGLVYAWRKGVLTWT